jgi:flagellar biosynthesis GTPase FlhF
MSEQTIGQGMNVKQVWAEMGERLAVAFPRWLIRRLTERGEGKGFVVKAIPFVLIFLSVASIANLATQAYNHHANYSSYMTGAGIAVLVPIAVLAAMLIEGKWSYAFWLMAVVFAGISGTIQYNIYHTTDALMSIAEAIAFGYGVPLSEVMLAVMEARLVAQKDEEKARAEAAQVAQVEAQRLQALAEQRSADEAAKQVETERKAQIRRDLDEEAERLRKQQEFEAKQLQDQREFELKLKLQEVEALAKIEMERLKVEAKLAAKPSKSESKSDSKVDSPDSKLIQFYTVNPLASQREAAESTGLNQPKVNRILKNLESSGVIHRNGNGVEIL